MSEQPGNIDPPNDEEEIEVDLEDENPEGDDGQNGKPPAGDPPRTKKKLEDMSPEELIAVNKRLFARAKTAEAKVKPVTKPPVNKSKEGDDGDAGTRLSKLELSERKRDFAWEHSLSPAETDKIFSFNPNPSADTLKDPFIQAGLAAIRRKSAVENATPSSSGRAPKVNGKEWKEMKPEEQKTNYSDLVKAKLNGRK